MSGPSASFESDLIGLGLNHEKTGLQKRYSNGRIDNGWLTWSVVIAWAALGRYGIDDEPKSGQFEAIEAADSFSCGLRRRHFNKRERLGKTVPTRDQFN